MKATLQCHALFSAHSTRRFLLMIFATFAVTSVRVYSLDLVVPAYFYPGDNGAMYWEKLAANAATVSLTVIMNPNNGPGPNQNLVYTNAIAKVRRAGGKVLGYVYSNYTRRAVTEVEDDVRKYRQWYDIDGFFVDEMSVTESTEIVQYYQTLYQFIKNQMLSYTVINNPGTNMESEVFAKQPVADRFMVFENTQAMYSAYAPKPWQANYQASMFIHLVYNAVSSDLTNDLQAVTGKGATGVYVSTNNNYTFLPPYWDQEVSEVATINAG